MGLARRQPDARDDDPYALYGLLQVEKAGHTIPNESAIQRGLHRLKHFIDAMHQPHQAADRIYCMYVWSHREKLEPAHWDWLAHQQKGGKLSDYANALCVEMCVAQDKKELAALFVGDLRAKAQKNASGQVSWKTAGFSRWIEDPFEITAAAMRAIVAFDKDDALVDGILGFFAATKRGDRWNSTKDTAMILFALCDYLAKASYNPDAKNELSYALNGKQSGSLTFDDKLTKKVTVDGSELKTGNNKLTFKTEMAGVMYRVVLRYWKAGRVIEPMDKGIKVARKFHLWDEKTKQIGKELKDGDAVPRGSYVVCDAAATYDTPGGMRFVLMECPKPSTAEVIPVDDPRFVGVQPNTGYALREERLASVAFHHEQTGQAVTNRVVMLAELAGDFVVPPAFVELLDLIHDKAG